MSLETRICKIHLRYPVLKQWIDIARLMLYKSYINALKSYFEVGYFGEKVILPLYRNYKLGLLQMYTLWQHIDFILGRIVETQSFKSTLSFIQLRHLIWFSG